MALPLSEPADRSRAAARKAEIKARAYLDAKPTALSPIALGSSRPLPWQEDIARSNTLTRRADNLLLTLEQLPVGADLAAGLTKLRGHTLGCDNAVRATALWQKVVSWASAQAMVTTAEALDSADHFFDTQHLRPHTVIGQELACATRTSMASALTHLRLTRQVAERMPKSWVALDRGQWSLTHLRALAQVTEHCPPRTAQKIEDRIVPDAIRRGWTPAEVRKRALRLLATIDPEGAADRARKAKANADVTFTPLPDETAIVAAYGDAVTVRRVMDTINHAAAAMRRGGDERSMGVLRFDAVAHAVLGETSGQPAAQALIAISADTIAGGDQAADLAGYGPLCAASARELAANATWRKLILDPGTGEALDLGMKAYRPNEPLIRFVKSRDWQCRFPGCSRPAEECDCDHRIDHRDEGPTSRWNLQLLCRLHHNLKTCKLWSSVLTETGEIEWTSPLGHVYSIEPHRLADLFEEPPEEPPEPAIATQLIDEPEPPWPDEPPPITPEQLEEYLDAIDRSYRDEWVRANERYDHFRRLGMIA